MNYYIVVEGQGEKQVYKSWIPYINPRLSYIDDLSNVTDNNFYIVSGSGYPNYFNVISNGIKDVNQIKTFQRMVISIDAEDMSYDDKFHEIDKFINEFPCISPIIIIIQYYCLETWGLGNRIIPNRNTTDRTLRSYYNFFNVIVDDPELMPSIDPENYTRAQFAFNYLHKIVNDRNQRITYSKSNPTVLTQSWYFEQIRNRLTERKHLSHFQNIIDAFS